MLEFQPMCLATGIGSMPHKMPEDAVKLIVGILGNVPFWPQLPGRSFYENMYTQYSENMPAVERRIDQKKIFFNLAVEGIERKLEWFYERYLQEDIESFKISADYASGFYEFLSYLETNRIVKLTAIKGQVVGPISFGLSVSDEHGRPIIYNPEFADVIEKGLAMKAIWQVKKFQQIPFFTHTPKPIIFFDEPYLVSLGSAYVNIAREEVIERLNGVIDETQRVGALVGVHCCGNIDWSILFETHVNIINFDAYNYLENFMLYPHELKSFLERGGIVAWGIVPSSNVCNDESCDSLRLRFNNIIKLSLSFGIPIGLLLSRSLITPSCGLGSLSEGTSEKILELTRDISSSLRKEYGYEREE